MIKNYLYFTFPLFLVLLIVSCSTPKKIEDASKKDNTLEMKKSLPVGMVELSCKFLKIFTKDNVEYCSAEVVEVYGYGSSVKAIAEEVQYDFIIDDDLKNSIDLNELVGELVKCRLITVPGGLQLPQKQQLKIISAQKI